jgi:DNA-binding MarR family transcriptional regulator
MSSSAVSADVHLASQLQIAIAHLARRLRAQRMDGTITLSQISALATLYRHGELSPTAVAELERVQPPSMTRVLAVLEQRGLVERRPHATDGRQAVIAITPAGRERVEEDRRKSQTWLARGLEELGATDLETLRAATALLERLAEN